MEFHRLGNTGSPRGVDGKPSVAPSVRPKPGVRWTRPVGIAVAAAGAVALGVASYEGLHSKSFVNDANASFNANQGAYRPQDLATIDSAKSASSLANVLFIAGGVLAATGLTMIFAF